MHDLVFDLFVELDANDDQLDFPLIYCSGKDGWASLNLDDPRDSMEPLMEAVIDHIPAPIRREGPLQMQVTSIDYNDYVGRIGVGRIYRGDLSIKDPMVHIRRNGAKEIIKLKQLYTFEGLERVEKEQVNCGDLCAVVGVPDIDIGDCVCSEEEPESLPPITVDEPTLSMTLQSMTLIYGQDGEFVTSRHLRDRLFKETERDVALKVEEVDGDAFKVSGRGVLHLSILIENMRRRV